MSNIKVSSDIDEILRKSTKAEVNAFLGVNTIKSNTDANTADIATNTGDISDNEDSIDALNDENQQLGEAISTANTNIATNATDIATNTADITGILSTIDGLNDADQTNGNASQTNAQNIATNTSNIATNTSNIATNTTAIATKANQSQVTSLFTTVTDHTNDILSNYNMIVSLESDANLLSGDVSTNTTNIATNSSNIATANTNIATNSTNLATKAPLDSPDFTGNVGINVTNPNKRLEVGGDVDVTGQVDANVVYAAQYLGGTGAFTDTSISGNLQVNGDISITGDINLTGGGDIDGDLTTDDITSDASITATALNSTVANIGIMDIDTNDVEFQNSDGSVMLHVNPTGDGVTLKSSDRAFIKEDCYYKSGAVRLQKASSTDDEILMRYNGPNSDDFLIQQFSGGSEKGHIKFLGNTSMGSRVRFEADQIDVGFNRSGFETDLVKIFSDTNIVANKKLVFKDSRDETHGLQFEHTGTNAPTIQMGMYGSFPDVDIGQFKITHTNSSGVNADVIVVDKDNLFTKIESAFTEVKNFKVTNGGYTQFGSMSTTNRNLLTGSNGMVIYNSTDHKFQGYQNGFWVDLS